MRTQFPLVTTPCETQEQLVSVLCSSDFLTVLDHALIGNHLWVVQQHPAKGPVLYCHVLIQRRAGWAYRTISEAHARSLLDCPPRLLEQAPVTNPSWRAAVATAAA
ncbi:hypothetical protein C7S18_23950 (plasmid) [Ahniella affigens]|uniref:Uncharacterized protein n=1 Tax=Ahniella affigens TaxID=2021234 RepID=A0A2P1PZX0_9GAMM|nr:hypothetical protein C7S18_23950 [Ahniella affigens]